MLNQPTALAFLARELGRRFNVSHAVLSPGSRCAPLILALAREDSLTAWSIIDERTAGFFALGLAKATGEPVILACTSGTAAAEYAPAVHEAREAGVPLIILTADRPPELRAAGENQTIDQLGVFGSAAQELPMPAFDRAPTPQWSDFAEHLVHATKLPNPGPVHVNVPLWDPLTKDPDVLPPLSADPAVQSNQDGLPAVPEESLRTLLEASLRPLLVLGRDESGRGGSVSDWASRNGVLCFADPLAGPVGGAATTASSWDALLRCDTELIPQGPDLVLRVGDLPTSKPLRTWLSALSTEGVPFVQAASRSHERDPLGATTDRMPFELTALEDGSFGSTEAEWTQAWLQAGKTASFAIQESLESLDTNLTELHVISRLAAADLNDSTLFVAASMPIRDLELLSTAELGPWCSANRGANGIDGTLAAGAGHAAATGRPTIVICGDVTFAHDIGGLAAVREASGPLTVVVIDNGGGAIFDNLPIRQAVDIYDKFILTPPALDIESAAKTFGLDYMELVTRSDLENVIEQRNREKPIVCRLGTGREAGQQARSDVIAAVNAALSA